MIREYFYQFGEDDPGNVVEALNTDRSLVLWDMDEGGTGMMLRISYEGIEIKIKDER